MRFYLFWVIPVATLLALAQGCSRNTLEDQLQAYQQKLARVLDQELPETTGPEWQPLPRARLLRLTFSDESINLLEFVHLLECDLNALVADHNSSLGRQAPSSQQLIYQLRFLASVERCIGQIEADHPELAETLASVSRSKHQQLPGYIWQATLGGREFRSFWQPDAGQVYAAAEFSELDVALARLKYLVERWLGGEYAEDPGELENLLATVRHGDGGRLLAAWLQLEQGLNTATAVLQGRGDGSPLCYPDMRTPQADIFKNVVMTDFVGTLQPLVARMNRRFYDSYQLVQSLESALAAAAPAPYEAWRAQRDAQLARARESVPAHVAALEPLMSQCGFLPG